jgi:hypothetical protein
MNLHPDAQTPGQHSASGFTDRGELLSIRTMPGARVLVGLSSESHSTQLILTPDEARAVLAELALAIAALEGEQ